MSAISEIDQIDYQWKNQCDDPENRITLYKIFNNSITKEKLIGIQYGN